MNTYRRILLLSFIALGTGLVLFGTDASADTIDILPAAPLSHAHPALSSQTCLGSNCSITQTTVADFNPGTFYLTGMTKNPQGGGDGDGEVRLLTIGISQADWNPTSSRPFPALFGHAAAQKNGIIYVSGGLHDPTGYPINTIYTSTIQSDHTLSPWLPSPVSLPVSLTFHSMVIVSNTLVVMGGADASGNPVTTTYTATVHTNGTLGSFHTAAPLPNALFDAGATVVDGTIYMIGGTPPCGPTTPCAPPSKLVYYTTPDPVSGAITSWLTATASLTNTVTELTAASYNNRFYEIGGWDANTSSPTYFPFINFAQPLSGGDVTVFTPTMPLNNNVVDASSQTFGGQLYVIGGATNYGQTFTNTIYSTIISPTGQLDDAAGWAASNVLSQPRARAASVVSDDGWIYVLGGVTGDPHGLQSALDTYDYGPTSGNNASEYTSSGTYISPVIDVGGSYTVTNILWNSTITTSNSMSMTFQYYCGSSPDTLSPCSGSTSGAVDGIRQTNTITPNHQARYWKYMVNFVRGSMPSQSPILNWVTLNYTIPYFPDFAVTGMTASAVSSNVITFTYWVENKTSISAPAKRQSLPRSPTLSPSYGFHVTFYADPVPVPTTPISLTGQMTCVDTSPLHGGGYAPFIFYNYELYKTPSPFYAQCTVPANTQNFYVQIDTCDASGDPYCTPYGYVQEKDELGDIPIYLDNILGPVTAGGSGGTPGGEGGNISFMPYISKNP